MHAGWLYVAVPTLVLTLGGCLVSSSPPISHGMAGPPAARTGCTAPEAATAHTVRVSLLDMGHMMMSGLGRMSLRAAPTDVPAGAVQLVAGNVGMRDHELVVLPLAAGVRAGARAPAATGKVDEAGSLGEASRNCGDGRGEGISPGRAGWTTITLAPGRYELLCNLKGHYAAGMYGELLVT